MASGNCSGLLQISLIILFALECCNANVHPENIWKMRKWLRASRQGSFGGNIATGYVNGRKKLEVVARKGKSRSDDLERSSKEPQKESNDIVVRNKADMFKQKGNNAPSGVEAKKNSESKAFLKAADEVATLMRRDYTGWNRRKSPIHNEEPKD